MQKKIFISLLLLIFPFSAALSISAWQASFLISPEGFSDAEILLVADSSASEQITIGDFGCETISAYDQEGSIASSLAKGQMTIVPRERITNYSFSIICSGTNFTRKEKEWLFSVDLPFSSDSGSIKVSLPPNAFLIGSTPEGKTFVENSKLSLIFDNATNVSVSYSFEKAKEEIKSDNSLLFIFAVAAIIIILAYFSFSYFRKKNKKGKEKETETKTGEKDYLKYLLDNEKKVVEVLQREKRITQRKLQLETSLPKSTLSRTLKKLELKGIVKCKDAGSTRFIELAE